MAKIKVHELAKELEIKSKDVITFLQEKGVDVKAAQSSIEGDAVEWVKKKFAAANKEPSDQKDSSRIGQAAQTERKAQVEKAETAEKTTQTAAVQAEGREEQTTDKQDMNKEVAGQDSQAKAHKKAKTMINKLTGENRVIVSDIAGTTRDAIDTDIKYNGREYVFIDTAIPETMTEEIIMETVQKMTGAEMMETEEVRTVRVTETTMACVWKADR